ncbi:MAG: lycopene cyclase domain-containing protein [Gemmatimonadales bacterium]|nr:MAG: lycopene cyclase domain-containing protein [Gemmatimonadales bacterium]
MTYLQFHLIFIVPPILLLMAGMGKARPALGRRGWWPVPAVMAIAFVYTTPWDNYLVWREVWWYGPDRVLGTIGWVPIEEYMFFLLQPVLTGLFTLHLVARRKEAEGVGPATIPGLRLEPLPSRPGLVRLAGGALWFGFAGLGAWLLTFESGVYMGLILAWACPVLALMWLYMGHRLWRWVHVMGLAIGLPTLWLWVADTIAIRQGIWTISPNFTLGPAPLGLPVEEAVFFLVTNVLCVMGVLLFAIPGLDSREDGEFSPGEPGR